MRAVIRCRGLTKHFGTTPAVVGVELEVERGEILALVGPSGCGKTTTLRLIAGFEVPDAGNIEIAGRVVAADRLMLPPEQRQVGMVFQDYALFPHLTVAQNIEFGLRHLSAAERRLVVDRILRLVGLIGLEARRPAELSGGQQQRVALARALAPQPAVVLLDEPFSNIDAGMRARVRADVREILAQAGATAIFVTHDQGEALALADRVAVMWQGRILQVGRPEEVYRRPATREVATFLGDMNSLPGEARPGRVLCELGELEAIDGYVGRVDVLIRPEALQVESDPQGEAEVVRREFFGHYQQLTVRLGSGRLMAIREWADRDRWLGQRVRVRASGPVSIFPVDGPIDSAYSTALEGARGQG